MVGCEWFWKRAKTLRHFKRSALPKDFQPHVFCYVFHPLTELIAPFMKMCWLALKRGSQARRCSAWTTGLLSLKAPSFLPSSPNLFFLPITRTCLSLSFFTCLLILLSVFISQLTSPVLLFCVLALLFLRFPSQFLCFVLLWSFICVCVSLCKCMFQLSFVSLNKFSPALQTAATHYDDAVTF